MTAIKKTSFFLALFILMFSAVFSWTESGLFPSENPDQSGVNDSVDLSLGAYPGGDYIGSGFIADSSDHDYYLLTIPDAQNNPDHDSLKVGFYVPPSNNTSYNLIIYMDDGAGGWNRKTDIYQSNGNTVSAYIDISSVSSQDWDFRFEVVTSSGNGNTINAYAITVAIVDSGIITGKINPVGVQASGAGGITVMGSNAGRWISASTTDSSGNFTLRAPVGVAVDSLSAVRNWYTGCDPDWAYGETIFRPEPSITIMGAGLSVSGINFNAYKEGVLAGTVTAGENVRLKIINPYMSSYDASRYMIANFTGAYALHNMAPGTYSVWVEPYAGQTSTQAVSYTAGVTITDGMTTTINYVLGTGHTLTGAVTPAPGSGNLQLFMAGSRTSGIDDWDPFKNYFRAPISGGVYTMRGIPSGTYDLRVDSGGPSPYLPSINTTVTSDAVINFTTPASDTTITGVINDNTSSFTLGQLFVFAIATGTGEILGTDNPSFFSMPDALGNFSISVPSSTLNYNIAVLAQNPGADMPYLVGSTYACATGTAGNIIYINNGIKISGSVNYLGQSIMDYGQNAVVSMFYPDGPFAPAMCGLGEARPVYDSGSYLPISATAYNVVVRAKSAFFNDQDITVSLSNLSLTGQDISMTLNVSKDKYAPYAGELIPSQNGYLSSGPEYLYTTVSDEMLGTGFNTVQIFSDGVPVSGLIYSDMGNNTRRYRFTLPPAHQVNGTAHSITMSISDLNGNIFNFNGGSWQVNVVSPTITPTMSPTFSLTPTYTATQPVCTVNGTITMPASQLGRTWIVIIDDDANGGNGFINMVSGITLGTTQYSYSLTATAGAYYIYSLVDVNGNGGFNDGGIDYAAIYGAVPALNPPAVANANVVIPSSTFDFNVELMPGASTPTITVTPGGPSETPTPVQCILSGTITLPAVSSGQSWFVILDNDTNGGNGYTGFAMGTTAGTNQISYNILASEGTYYLYAAVDTHGLGMPSGPQAGDYMGFYGGSPVYAPPGAPNAVISCPVGNIDFTLAEIPGAATPTSTITPGGPTFTFTSTPCAISGEVTMPAVSNGVAWYVLIDNDFDGGNGAPYMVTGTTNGTDKFTYNAAVSPGTYYVYGVVDISGQVMISGPQAGDYFGYRGGIPPLNPPGAPNVAVTCLGVYDFNLDIMAPAGSPTFTATPGGPSATFTATVTSTAQLSNVSGTITMPAASSGKTWYVLFDDDVNGGNGFAFAETGTTSGTNQFTYNAGVAPGTYYIYAVVDENGTGMPSGPVSGDYAGVYGGGPGPWDAPGAANAVIILPTGSFDFNVVLIPYPTETITPTHSITPTVTETITGTPPTSTETQTFTVTATFTGTSSDTPTNTATLTWTLSSTLTPTLTSTLTSTDTASPTLTWTLSSTLTPTLTYTLTSTDTASPTFTWTLSSTLTPTLTYTLTSTDTASPTSTWTLSSTLTATLTSTMTSTETVSPTSTWTLSSTLTPTLTYTLTSTDTASPTSTWTLSSTLTPTLTYTMTHTPTLTHTSTSTITMTETPSYTVTLTYTVTDIPTASPTFTVTSTQTQAPSAIATETQTPSFIAKAYPQPAGNSITFAYKLSKAGKVTVNVFNLSGLPVAALDAGIKGTGDNASTFDISVIAPGIYFYIIKSDTGDKFGVNKFVVER